jgi:Pentapeptide repeats (8 copies)
MMTEIVFGLPKIIADHALWFRNKGGKRADLRGADLSNADLSNAFLSHAFLTDANLSGANLSRAYLSGADLSNADLSGTNLSGTNLSGTNQSGTALIDGGQRSDGHRFIGQVKENRLWIFAACRYFPMAQGRRYWLSTRGGTPLGDETMCILDHIEKVAVIRGFLVIQTEDA